eukprot:CAMPEP_0198346366 /NCGR_PEP_ID=MMETSP1450-20131203/79208_1 /TAXON_ID=753684 ORGANISM="Madagascaria erythrocladiodes, Strain CCMP3234" /NCGR_SAMPLE_ID=MMETSP1450 /ASSEMBLY_ACC=CAM_ASM_001115 /LENGTH=59 /DNA_ID=CAMNT_0044051787 /DNA_START=125 /DNA_END=301 /DNA_ORIENTATION=+
MDGEHCAVLRFREKMAELANLGDPDSLDLRARVGECMVALLRSLSEHKAALEIAEEFWA